MTFVDQMTSLTTVVVDGAYILVERMKVEIAALDSAQSNLWAKGEANGDVQVELRLIQGQINDLNILIHRISTAGQGCRPTPGEGQLTSKERAVRIAEYQAELVQS